MFPRPPWSSLRVGPILQVAHPCPYRGEVLEELRQGGAVPGEASGKDKVRLEGRVDSSQTREGEENCSRQREEHVQRSWGTHCSLSLEKADRLTRCQEMLEK